ncbi:MAG: hypothetical protein ACE5H5_03895, partial [Nitrospinota bacterium]
LLGLDETLARFMEPINLTAHGTALLTHGSPVEEDAVLRLPATVRAGGVYRALDGTGRLIAIVEAQEWSQRVRWIPRRVIAAPI